MRVLLNTLALITTVAALSCESRTVPAPNDCSANGGGPAGKVTVGNNFFRSARNGTCNTAVDTISAGGSVTWTWTGTTSHSVRSQGTPSFPSSEVLTGEGQSFAVTFETPGAYEYDCSVHASQMTGRVVVQ
jgi:plastocyanin